jgi:lysophospholipase L1-like esterase
MVPLTNFAAEANPEMKSPLKTQAKPAFVRSVLLLFALTATAAITHAAPPPPDHWVGTWASAPMAANNGRMPAPTAAPPSVAPPATSAAPVPPASAQPAAPVNLASTPSQARPAPFIYGAADTTLREIVHVSIGGPQVRVIFTNEFGTDSLTIGAAHVGVSQGGSTVNLVSAAGLTFGGHTMVTIPPGALVVSDPAAVNVPAGSDLAISFFLPAQAIQQISQHGYADQVSYTAPGNVVGAKTLDDPAEIHAWPFVKGIDVKVPAHAGAIVAFGDSITDGAYATQNMNARWPDELARRLLANPKTADLGVLNLGIGGNRILHDNTGPSALARFDRDVIAQAGVKYVVVLEAINDIGHAYDPGRAYDVVSADDLIGGYIQMAARAHTHGIKIYCATLTPYTGAKYMSPAGEEVRQTLNRWIRTSHEIDGFIDFEKVTQDPANPAMFLPAYDHGDHLHPADAGYKAMGDAIDLNLFIK